MKPTIGRIVLLPLNNDFDRAASNRAEVVPAIITRVWSDTLVNVVALLDGPATAWKTSVQLHAGPDEYAEAVAAGHPHGCYWPPRA